MEQRRLAQGKEGRLSLSVWPPLQEIRLQHFGSLAVLCCGSVPEAESAPVVVDLSGLVQKSALDSEPAKRQQGNWIEVTFAPERQARIAPDSSIGPLES